MSATDKQVIASQLSSGLIGVRVSNDVRRAAGHIKTGDIAIGPTDDPQVVARSLEDTRTRTVRQRAYSLSAGSSPTTSSVPTEGDGAARALSATTSQGASPTWTLSTTAPAWR